MAALTDLQAASMFIVALHPPLLGLTADASAGGMTATLTVDLSALSAESNETGVSWLDKMSEIVLAIAEKIEPDTVGGRTAAEAAIIVLGWGRTAARAQYFQTTLTASVAGIDDTVQTIVDRDFPQA